MARSQVAERFDVSESLPTTVRHAGSSLGSGSAFIAGAQDSLVIATILLLGAAAAITLGSTRRDTP